MGVAGTINPTGGAPKPDPARVAAIRYTIVDEPETCAAFGESARAGLASLNERTLAEIRSGDLGDCGRLLDHVRDRVAALDPARLEPRKGPAGLFDSRSKRLKAFRAAYASAAGSLAQSAADIGDRAGALSRKGTALETLWSETRDAIAELDAHIAAARGWLANEAPAVEIAEPAEEPVAPPAVGAVDAGIEPDAERAPDAGEPPAQAAEAASEAASEPGPAPVVALLHPLETRLAALEAVRATAIGRLPLIRAAQNADHQAPATLKRICEGIEAWRADWHDALGLASKKPKTIRPDRVRLTGATSELTDRLDAAGRELSETQGRRAELDTRVTTAAPAKGVMAA